MNYWVFKTVTDKDRSYQSHDGYDDVLSSKYIYDSNVANSKQEQSYHLIVLVDKEHILGFAKISRIKNYPSTKEISRCPECSNTNYEARKTKTPKYRCNQGHEFKEPIKGVGDIIKYEAFYGDSFSLPENDISITVLKEYFNRGYNRNMSIQSIDEQFFKDIDIGLFEKLKKGIYYIDPNTSDESNEPDIPYSPTDNDERDKVNRQITERRGQQKFRKDLLENFDSKCCITGCSILHLLEAAHIKPYKGVKDNHPSNGLLLRAGIHTLFDLDMIGIHPVTLIIHINDEIRKDNYELLDGIKVNGNPSIEALRYKWDLFNKNK